MLATAAVALALILFFVFSVVKARREAGATFERAVEALNAQRWQDAVRDFEVVLRSKSNNAEAISGLGKAYYHLENYPEALKLSRRMLSFSPGDQDAQVRVASCLFHTGEVDEALAEFKNLLLAYPNSFVSRFFPCRYSSQCQDL